MSACSECGCDPDTALHIDLDATPVRKFSDSPPFNPPPVKRLLAIACSILDHDPEYIHWHSGTFTKECRRCGLRLSGGIPSFEDILYRTYSLEAIRPTSNALIVDIRDQVE